MKKLTTGQGQLIGQLIVTVIILGTFYGCLSSKKVDVSDSVFITTVAVIGFAGAFFGIFAAYAIGASAAIFICAIVTGSIIAVPLAFASIITAFFFTSYWEKHGKPKVGRKVLWSSNAAQFIIILMLIMNTILGK